MKALLGLFFGCLALGFIGCGEDDDGAEVEPCVADEVKECPCDGGGQCVQVCIEEEWSRCYVDPEALGEDSFGTCSDGNDNDDDGLRDCDDPDCSYYCEVDAGL